MVMQVKSKDKIVGILIGRAETPEKACSISHFFGSCPYCALSTSAGTTVLSVLSLPANHRWWLDSIVENPKKTIGIEDAEVFYVDHVPAQSPWSAGEIKAADKPPCGADCLGCPEYKKSCPGCIATHYYSS
jgi:hypothetical protein